MDEQSETVGAGQTAVISRRTFLKHSVKWSAGLLGTLAFGGAYVSGIEPRWLEVVRIKLSLPTLPPSFRGVTIAQFSDVHFDYHFGLKRLKDLGRRIQSEQPDIICFTGDLVDESVGRYGEDMSKLFRELHAPLGKFAVLGNHDYYEDSAKVANVLIKGGFRCLRNESVLAEKDGNRIRITGVEDFHRGHPNIKEALKSSKPEEFVLLLSHTPDFASTALKYSVHLQLSGHSHGGQVRLPFKGPAVLVPGARLYPEGHYHLGNGKLQLYVNRGVGVTGLPIRFLCRPELTLITLV